MIDKDKVEKSFESYVEKYNLNDPKIHLKVTHTYRVANLSEKIAKSLSLSEEEVKLAWLIGMLHDLGRFEQLRMYGTFEDAKSIDHALCSAGFLFDEGHIRDYIEQDDYDTVIQAAVANHSLYRLPDDLSERQLLYCTILRDADKIDILKVNVEESLESIYGASAEEIAKAEITQEVLQAFLEKHAVNHSLKKTVIDRSVGHASLVFELVYPISVQIVKEQGYLKKILDFESQNPKTRQQYEQMRQCMENFLADFEKNYKHEIFNIL